MKSLSYISVVLDNGVILLFRLSCFVWSLGYRVGMKFHIDDRAVSPIAKSQKKHESIID